ncbi:MAG: short-chain dehydrogenase/reductase SDR [Idiomarina sp. T82-3]|jgi:Dehydrogenases with different specificities (related to short-chain alcohol dehydrogenases)|uniref:SDR family NAD(P)-dependent oxidoreductase n=1 Tax=Idiomarina TaxID=135575 RepID=UPI00079B5CC2|nr:SDR family oxidoreductase [Idiomarina sp. T82-3]KXS34189.1 MAG: short-chain dehydrogenase/reductase SDR [Idiomarina sp. T82-3]
MIIDLKGKTALVTGSTGGIGLAIAKGLAKAGAEVYVVGRTQDNVDSAVNGINEKTHVKSRGLVADLGTVEGCSEIIEQLREVDILINNLGIYGACSFFDISDEKWDNFFEVNVMSSVRLSRHYAKSMKKNGWGRIQFISSESALNIPEEMVHYGVTKSALQGLSRGLAKVLKGSGVTVNTVLPGPTRTKGALDMLESMASERGVSVEEMESIFLSENRPSTLINRFASPEEVANMSVYIASKEASATTGAALRVEGGIVESIS